MTRPISCALAARRGKRERLHARRRQAAVDKAHIIETQELAGCLAAERPADQIACAAGQRPKRKIDVRRLGGDRGVDVSRDRCGGVLGDVGNPARVLRRLRPAARG